VELKKRFINSYSSTDDCVLYSTFADIIFSNLLKKIGTEFYSSLFSPRAVTLYSLSSHRHETFAISSTKFKKNYRTEVDIEDTV
jgi:hypothetical protein